MNRDCMVCGEGPDTLMVGAVEGGSGPGHTLYACMPHARMFAENQRAPKWLKDAVASRDAQQALPAGGAA